MFRFVIKYHFERYHTGNINLNSVRTATVTGDDIPAAIDAIKRADKDFICIANEGVSMSMIDDETCYGCKHCNGGIGDEVCSGCCRNYEEDCYECG